MRAFDLEEFKAKAMGTGFIRPACFLVAIRSPRWFGKETSFLTYLCSAAALPGSIILTSAERVVGYGKPQEIPFDTNHTQINLQFYSDGAGRVNSFFEEWMRNIVAFGVQGTKNIKGAIKGEVQYPDHYETTLEIFQFNEVTDGSPEVLRYTLDGAFPISVAEQQLDWSNESGISMVNVTFAYTDYQIVRNSVKSYSGWTSLPGSSVLEDLGYLQRAMEEGFASEFAERSSRLGQAESLTAGILSIGLDKFSAALGAISSVAGSINDAISTVNNLGSSLNSAISTVSPSLGSSSSIPSVPSIPPVYFP
jgi:hypothetical protein